MKMVLREFQRRPGEKGAVLVGTRAEEERCAV